MKKGRIGSGLRFLIQGVRVAAGREGSHCAVGRGGCELPDLFLPAIPRGENAVGRRAAILACQDIAGRVELNQGGEGIVMGNLTRADKKAFYGKPPLIAGLRL